MRVDFFEGFDYCSLNKYIHKIVRSFNGLLADRSLEYNDLVEYGLMSAVHAFNKWDAKYDNDRSDSKHLEAYIKTCVAGNMTNLFRAHKRANQLVNDEDDMSDVNDSEFDVPSNVDEEDINDIRSKAQCKYAKVFHASGNADIVEMMDVASFINDEKEETDPRMDALERFVSSLKGFDLDIMNHMLMRSNDKISDISKRYNVSPITISAKKKDIMEAARDFILSYV